MAIIVEVLNRGGQVLAVHKFDQEQVTIGRAMTNDVILHDPHLDGQHMRLEFDPASHNLYCVDRKSLNGVWLLNSRKPGRAVILKNKSRLAGHSLFYSGQQFLIGHTVIRVYHSDHPVVAPAALSRWEEIGHTLGHWWIWLAALACVVALQSLDAYFNDPTQKKSIQYILPSGYAVLAALVYAGIWAFVGRNLKHESKFATHLSIAAIALLISGFLGWVLPILTYNSGLWWLHGALDTLIGAALVFAVVLLALFYATLLKPVTRILVASIAPLAMLLSLVIDTLTMPDFQPAPAYETAMVAPHWQWRRQVSADQFLQETQELYNREVTPTPDEDEGD